MEMKIKKIILCLLIAASLCGCSRESVKTCDLSADGNEVIMVILKAQGRYDLRSDGSKFTVIKGSREVAKGYIETEMLWMQVLDEIEAKEAEVIERNDDRIIWIQDEMISSLEKIPDAQGYGYSYADLSSGITEKEFQEAVSFLSYELKGS